ncbi:MAG TPA: LysR family transcriptional regulator, partial [Rhizomicrobium sp.]|nr:LysR family transcriptional regulator [Rhizomicrobium sp.]
PAEHGNYYAAPDWAGARVLLEVVRSGSFRGAATKLGMSINTLRHRLSEFERQVGLTLVTRHIDGVRLTAEGEVVLEAATRMETASFDFMHLKNRGAALKGEVRLGITDGLGAFWLAPRLVDFHHAHPDVIVNMRCAMQPADVMRLETDLAIQLFRPVSGNLKVVKLGRLHAMPFASQKYLDTHGTPKTRAELRKHRIVLMLAEQVVSIQEYKRVLPGVSEIGTISLKSNNSNAHYWFVARSAGIGILPTYLPAAGARVVPIDIEDLRYHHDIWLTYHPDASRTARVRRLIDWLVDAFSPQRNPWFRDEFIHPRDLPPETCDAPLPELFDPPGGSRPPRKPRKTQRG